jgi:KDO2-lipid IV(A) lauroyltransferase
MPRPTFSRKLLAPRHWPAWLGVAMLAVIGRLPPAALSWLGRRLGGLVLRIASPRRHIAETNIALCFPDLDVAERAALVNANLRDVGMMLVEFAQGWMCSDRQVARIPTRIEGPHLELAARLVSQRIRIAGMYRKMDSAVFESVILRARLNYADAMFDKDDIRGTVRYLRNGGTLWYAPDQDMRSKDRVFVPFFGVPAATITATHHLARLSGALVMPFFHRRLPDGKGYVLTLGAPLENFPGPNVLDDTARINACIEQMVREAPEQYLWVHQRFKTRPPGLPPVY